MHRIRESIIAICLADGDVNFDHFAQAGFAKDLNYNWFLVFVLFLITQVNS